MDFDRIRPTIDVDRMQQCHITVVGGGFGLALDLARCGAGAFTLIDFDHADATNPARQDFTQADIGRFKVDVVGENLRRINPNVEVTCLTRDFCSLSPAECDMYFNHTDLFAFAADAFPAQARGNRVALRQRKAAIWIGLYRGARAGEIVYFVPGLTQACYRCNCSARYRAFAAGQATRTASIGGTILDLRLVDAIAGQLAVGILTRGAPNRMGQLIDKLGQRNFLQIKLDPDYRLGQRDIFAEHLGNSPANFSFTTIALPMTPEPDCPDCLEFNVAEAACDASSKAS